MKAPKRNYFHMDVVENQYDKKLLKMRRFNLEIWFGDSNWRIICSKTIECLLIKKSLWKIPRLYSEGLFLKST